MDKNLIAKRIQQYRRFERTSQEALADKVGVSDTYIRKMEAGERTPSLKLILELADALHTTPNHLLLPASSFDEGGIISLLSDCSTAEAAILYENMLELKTLLRKHRK